MKFPGPTEHQIQAAFVQWCHLAEPKYPGLRLGFAVPNGGRRNKITASLLKAEGVRPGVPDWMCPVEKRTSVDWIAFRGIAIEFKKHGGHVTPPQRDYIELLREYEWFVEVCYSGRPSGLT